MHRIIIVEDERQSLAKLCEGDATGWPKWHLRFSTGAGPTIAACDEDPADVAVLDLGALGLSGLELMTYLRTAHPATACLVLAGTAGPELTYRALPRAQHCLTKPVDVGELGHAIQRVLGVQDRLANPDVRMAVREGEVLPRVPLFSRLSELILDDASTAGQLAEVVSGDDAITERMITLVNSKFFGLTTSVKDPRDAITILGPTTLRALVLNLELFRAARSIDCPGLDGEQLRAHALAAAALASKLVEGTNAWNHVRVAGLLHDIGRIVLAAAAPAEYGQVLAAYPCEGAELIAAERAAFGFTHAEVGAVAADLWGLPWTIVEPIALHHDPSPSWFDEPFDERHAVYIAERLMAEGDERAEASVDEMTAQLAVHGLDKELQGWREATLECLEREGVSGDGEPRQDHALRDAG